MEVHAAAPARRRRVGAMVPAPEGGSRADGHGTAPSRKRGRGPPAEVHDGRGGVVEGKIGGDEVRFTRRRTGWAGGGLPVSGR